MIRYLGILLFGTAVLLVVALTRRPSSPSTTFQGFTMGTSFTVRLSAHLDPSEQERWQVSIQQLLDGVNERMSTYRSDSEVSRFNRFAADDWFPVSADTAAVVATSLDVARWTDGVFDITVSPLVNLWSFGPDQRPVGIPTPSEIAAARERVDYRLLSVRLDPPALRKQHPALSIDLSGIAKGFAVDGLAELLDSGGFPGYMVEIGGEVRTKGLRSDGRAWRIGLEAPRTDRRVVEHVLEARDCCLASSGDYRNFFEWEGVRYSHEIDPRTGWPARQDTAAVSVIGPSVMLADALATALMVLPADEAWQLAQDLELEVLMVIRHPDRLETRVSAGFPIADRPNGS